jgi:hypothetical protein
LPFPVQTDQHKRSARSLFSRQFLGRHYKLTVPQPVPGKLFWSITVYDAETRSQIATDQGKAALRSMFELKNKMSEKSVDLYFGPKAVIDHEGEWIKTIPGAFDGSWKPGDFEQIGNLRVQS